jgi:hypothetical protein
MYHSFVDLPVFGLRNRGTKGTAPGARCSNEGIKDNGKEAEVGETGVFAHTKANDSCPYGFSESNGFEVVKVVKVEVIKEGDSNN